MWTEDRVETLKKLWAEGLSASQIAKQLGGVTRNAVIGKVHRLGLSGRAAPSRPARHPEAKPAPRPRAQPAAPAKAQQSKPAAPAQSVVRAEPAAPVEAERLASGEYATVLTLKDSMCKWPIGDPADPKFAFCGRKSDCGPYCSEHAKVAFQPQRKRERKRNDDEAYARRIAG